MSRSFLPLFLSPSHLQTEQKTEIIHTPTPSGRSCPLSGTGFSYFLRNRFISWENTKPQYAKRGNLTLPSHFPRFKFTTLLRLPCQRHSLGYKCWSRFGNWDRFVILLPFLRFPMFGHIEFRGPFLPHPDCVIDPFSFFPSSSPDYVTD